MATLSIRPAELRSRANALEQLRQEHLSLMKQLRILVMSLSEDWQGEAQSAFQSSFLSKSQTMNDLANTLERYISLANQAADEAERVDSALLSAVRRLS